jgi:glutamate dehydrogenase/leucine dehydrogenase
MPPTSDQGPEWNHEDVVFVDEPEAGLRAIIAVHSTALGPSLGGIRFWRYARDDDALADVLRLSEAMTLKAACAGLHQGGGKAVVLTDDPARAAALSDLPGVEVATPERALVEPCDVLSPCALGGVLDVGAVSRLRCRAVVGGANNQLVDAAAGDALVDRGIVYAPDFVVNAGGIINIAEEFTGYDRARAIARTEQIETTTGQVLAAGREWDVSPARAAERIARDRIARDGRDAPWQPGDPAAWTGGAPLIRVRPLVHGTTT